MAKGDFTAVQSWEFDTSQGTDPCSIHIDGTIYACVYGGLGTDGYLATFDISDTGVITTTLVDSWEFDGTNCETPYIFHISGTTYGIVYSGTNNDGYLTTVTIANNGTITKTAIDSWEFDTTNAMHPHAVHVGTTKYAIFYSGADDDGWVGTVDITTGGTITKSWYDTLEFNGTHCGYLTVTRLGSSQYWAVAYESDDGVDDRGYLSTINIATDGTIAASTTDDWEWDTTSALTPFITNVDGTTYAIAYEDQDDTNGELFTLTISDAGVITKSKIDTLTFETTNCQEPCLRQHPTNADLFFVAYSGTDTDGYCKSFTITSGGTISTVIDTLEFDTTDAFQVCCRVHLDGDYFALFYNGYLNDGYVATLSLAAEKTAFETFATLTNLEKETFATFAANSTLEDEGIATFAANATLEDEGIATFAANSTLEDEGQATFAANSTLEDEGTATFAANSTLEAIDQTATFAANSTLEDEGITTFATSTDVEDEGIATFATYTILEEDFAAATFAANSTLEAINQTATFAGNATVEDEGIVTFATLTDLEDEGIATFATLTVVEDEGINTFATYTTLEEEGAFATFATYTILESYDQFATFATDTALEDEGISTFATYTTLEEEGAFATFASYTILESYDQFAVYGVHIDLESPTEKPFATLTTCEAINIRETFAVKVELQLFDITLPGDDEEHWDGGFPVIVNM